MRAKTSFVTLHNNANMLISMKMVQTIFLFHKKMRNSYLGNYTKRGRKIFTCLNRRHEKQNNGSKWTPLCT